MMVGLESGAMKRLTALLAAAMLVTAGLPAAATVADQSANSGVQPGAQFAGAVDVQGAEVEGEVEGRALDRRFAAADSNASRAGLVAEESERASERLEALRERRSDLRERYESDSISESEYRARLAGIAAEARTLERRLNETAEVARSLPAEVARERGANASEIAALRRDAAELNDDEAAEAARSVAGDGVGNGLGGPPENVGPPGNEAGDRDGDDRGNSDDGGPPNDAGPDERRGDGADDRANGNSTADGDAADGTETDEGPGQSGDRGNGSDGAAGGNGSAGEPGESRGNDGDTRPGDGDADGNSTTETDDSTAAADATLTPTPTAG